MVLDTDRLFICDNHMQRLIFYSGHPWEAWEQDHIDKFKQFLLQESLALSPSFREEEILRMLHASQFNYKKALYNIENQL